MTFFNYLSSLPPAIAQGMIWGIMAIGVYFTYKVLDIADLTVDGSMVTGMAICTVMVAQMELPMWLGLLCAVAVGMACGLVTQLMLWSVTLKIMGNTSNIRYPFGEKDFLSSEKADIAWTILWLEAIVIVLVCLLYWFFGTKLGSAVRATGCNIKMARAQGINTDAIKVLGLVISNGVVGFSGGLLSVFLGFSDANAGRGAIVIGLAAVIIGEALFSRITRYNFALRLLAVVAGGIIYYMVYQNIIYLRLDATYLKMFSALIVALFLAVPFWKTKYVKKLKKYIDKLNIFKKKEVA